MTQEEFQEQVLRRLDGLDTKIDCLREEMNGKFAHLAYAMVNSGMLQTSDFETGEGLTMKSWNPEE